jgi:hypothetical protein
MTNQLTTITCQLVGWLRPTNQPIATNQQINQFNLASQLVDWDFQNLDLPIFKSADPQNKHFVLQKPII